MSHLSRASTVSAATLASRLAGFARDAGTAAVLGAGPVADALMAALSLSQVARRLLAEGAFNAAVIPALVRGSAQAGENGARRIASGTLLLLGGLLIALAVLAAVFMPALIRVLAPGFEADGARAELAVACGRVAVLYLPLAGMAAVYGAVANHGGRILLPALAPLAANLVALAVIAHLVLAGVVDTSGAALTLAGATVLSGVAQLAVMLAAARGCPAASHRRLRADFGAARSVLRASAPALLFAGVSQFRLLVVAAVASSLPGAVAALTYAQRLVDLPLGLVGASAGAVLVPLLAGGGRGARREAAQALLASLALALPAGVGLAVLAAPIVEVLYQRGSFDAGDSVRTAGVLSVLAIALPVQGIERILSATALAHGLTRETERTGLLSLAACLAAALLLQPLLGPAGGAAAVAVSAAASCLLLGIRLLRSGHLALDRRILAGTAWVLGMGALMGGTVAAGQWAWPAPSAQTVLGAVRLAALVGLGVIVYGAGLAMLRGRLVPPANEGKGEGA